MSEETFEQDAKDIPTPWSFKIMVVLATAYLGWRLIQGIAWLIQALSN